MKLTNELLRLRQDLNEELVNILANPTINLLAYKTIKVDILTCNYLLECLKNSQGEPAYEIPSY